MMFNGLRRRLRSLIDYWSRPIDVSAAVVGSRCPVCGDGRLIVSRIPDGVTYTPPGKVYRLLTCGKCGIPARSSSAREGSQCHECDLNGARLVVVERVTRLPAKPPRKREMKCFVTCDRCDWKPSGETWTENVIVPDEE